MLLYAAYLENASTAKNPFRGVPPKIMSEDSVRQFMATVPEIWWPSRPDLTLLYNKCWEIMLERLRHPTPENGFVGSFIDTAFNDCTFMWDSTFIVQFAKYAVRSYDFMAGLDNFYAKQHPDGFICREIGVTLGEDRFERFNPVSTGPNIMAWCEWRHYLFSGNTARLAEVFPALVAYHRWFRLYRTWPDGSYWNTGWGSGLDNSPRVDKASTLVGFSHDMGFDYFHGWNTWVDACCQQSLSAQCIQSIAGLLGRADEVADIAEEGIWLDNYINSNLWDADKGFYFDRQRDGSLHHEKTIAAFWALAAGIPDDDRSRQMIAHLKNPQSFASRYMVPSLSTDSEYFSDDPIYWQGGVWAPSTYMILAGLTRVGQTDLAREIALNTLEQVNAVFKDTGTLWEYYSPEHPRHGAVARPDFVGWTGLVPVAMLIENVFGIRIDAPSRTVYWDIGIIGDHGIKRLPLFDNGSTTLLFHQDRATGSNFEIVSDTNFTLHITHGGKSEVLEVTANAKQA